MDTSLTADKQRTPDTITRVKPIDINKALGAQIRAHRRRRRWSRKRLAKQTRSSKKAIMRMESGAYRITVRRLYVVCKVLRVEPRDLVAAAQAETEIG
ncbi:helix-turn-helix domain-containing protein [Nocardia sp. 004]|uniref:helix-turn-helix domain-containing protein n=1 Tax=Nocardia sp. 004 TaxID=3385978 RepID=UPI0039A230F5